MENEPTQPTQQTTAENESEREVALFFEEFNDAIRAGKIDDIMACFASDVIAYDMMPPLEFVDRDEFRKVAWEDYFTNYFQFPVALDVAEQKIAVHGDVAFSHALVHLKGTVKDGKAMDCWLRTTAGLRKIDGGWKIVHEHTSVPIDVETEKGLMNLEPKPSVH